MIVKPIILVEDEVCGVEYDEECREVEVPDCQTHFQEPEYYTVII